MLEAWAAVRDANTNTRDGRVVSSKMSAIWGLGSSVAVLCVLLGLPGQFGMAFSGAGATVCVGAFLGAAAIVCAAVAWMGFRCAWLLPWLAWAQVIGADGVTAAVVWSGAETVGIAGALGAGLALGVGHASTLLLWVPQSGFKSARDALSLACAAFAVVALVGAPLVVAGTSPGLCWGYMTVVAGIASALAAYGYRRSREVGGAAPRGCGLDEAVVARGAKGLATLAHAWEPVVGLALSLISLAVPWGSFLDGEQSSVPPLSAVAVGWLAVSLVALACRSAAARRISLDLATNIGIPVLAALVVVLWMVGDVSVLPGWGVALKGFGSGVACGSFFVLAWTALTCGVGGGARPWRTVGMGFACAFALAASILVLHAIGDQSVASAVSPVASLGFLVVVCVVSAVRLARMGAVPDAGVGRCASGGVPASDSWEEAVAALACDGGLSPRETEVLGYLVGGRTAEGIAEVMGISPHTVRAHVRKIHEKLRVSSRDQIAQLVEERRRG